MVNEPKRSILEGIENTGDVHLHDHRLRLKQRFEIIRKLGQGTYGKVQLGINKKTGQEVAIKTIKKCKIETEADLVRLRREVQIMSSVRHPNIIHIYEVFENSEKMILVMEYCSGGELYDYLNERKVLQEDEARRLFRQIATAVYYCHKHKICHRDLKLENVLLDEHGSAKIADFGLSNVFEEKRLLSTFCGSPLYASPEIVKGTPYIGPEVDCWSIGVLLYTLVYGAMPFDGSNFKRLVKQISTGDYFEPKYPSSASPLIRDMLTVDPIQRADITHICDHPWVNKGSDQACLELAEALANETPVRLDLLLSLAPPPVSDKLVVTDEVTAAGPDGSPGRSMSMAAIDGSAERRILEMVAEGGTDAIKPSPTRTIVGAEQPKRKLETTVSMDNAPSQRKKERFLRSSSKVDNNMSSPQNETNAAPIENNCHPQGIQKDVSMVEQNNVPENTPKAPSPVVSNQKVNKTPTREVVNRTAPVAPTEVEPENIVPNQVTNNNHVGTPSPTKTSIVKNKETKPEVKPRDSVLKEKNTVSKPSIGVKKKISSLTSKNDDKKVVKPKEKSPPRKSIEKDVAKKVTGEENNKTEAQSIKQPTEKRKSRILDAAEKLNNLTIQPAAPVAPPPVASPPPTKPKKVLIPGVSVGSFKEQFERRASLTSGTPAIEKKTIKSPPGQTKTLADKKMNSVDSEHPIIPVKPVDKEPGNVKLQNIGIEPPRQAEVISPPEPEIPKKTLASDPPAPLVTNNNNNKITRPLFKSESLRDNSKKDSISNSVSLEDAKKSLQQSMALINQAKNDYHQSRSVDDSVSNSSDPDRQVKLKAAREIISNAIGDDNNTGKKVQRICMAGSKPPVPYGAGGRSTSGSLNLSSLGGSPPMSPPHQSVTSPTSASATPPRTYRTEVQHRMDDVRNKFLPTTRGGSIERIIPIHFTTEVPNKPQPPQQPPPQPSGQLPYQRNHTMPYRLSSVPRSSSVQPEPERESSQPPTPFTPLDSPRVEPIKKSPREFIIPIAVEGVGYVTPRQGSLEPSDTPTKILPSRFPKPRRLSSLVSGGESEDEEDMHMHRLRSSRRARADPEKDSVSSGEEDDEDDEGFELLTAENLFTTLLDRVRNLTNRLNGEEGTGFPQRHQSLFNNLHHSPFFNSPHLPRKHNMHSLIREGPSWRRSTSRDLASDFDSMFPGHTTFPRGSRRSSRKGVKHNGDQQQQSSSSHTTEQPHPSRDTAPNEHDTQNPPDHLDLSDLDLSKIQLTEKEMETLSGLTPGLSRRLQRQLLSRLPPAAARSLRRTLSAHLPPNHHPHHYTRSLSASKTDPLSCTSPIEGEPENIIEHKANIAEDEEESSVSYNSARSFADKELKESSDRYSDVSDMHSINNDRSSHSIYTTERSKSPSVTESLTPHVSSNSKQTPDRSVLSKYLSPERVTVEKYPVSSSDYEYPSLLTEPSYIAAYGNPNLSSIPIGGSLRRRNLRTPPIENGQRRISRFLRPDFFDTPREESIYVKDKKDKELETQKVLKEIRQKRLRPGESYLSCPTSPLASADIPNMFETSHSRSSISPLGNSGGRDKSRSITPFYPSLDNISEHHTPQYTSSFLRSALLDINKHCTDDSPLHGHNISTHNNEDNLQPYSDSQIVRPKSYPSKPVEDLLVQENVQKQEEKQNVEQTVTQKVTPVVESKLLRPKSYPSTSPSPEKFLGILPKPCTNSGAKSKELDANGDIRNSSDYDKQNISVSFNVSIPVKSNKIIIESVNKNVSPSKATISVVQNDTVAEARNPEAELSISKIPMKTETYIENNVSSVNLPDKANAGQIRKSLSKENVTVKTNIALPKKSTSIQPSVLKSSEEKSPEKKSESPASQSSPSKDSEKAPGEEKKKKIIIKKKVIVKKKGSVKKTEANKDAVDTPVDNEEQPKDAVKDPKIGEEKSSVTKKKSMLHSIGERFERFRNDSFNKGASQEKEVISEPKVKDQPVSVKEEKPSRIENVIRALRERSVPSNNQEEQVTESGLIKRAVTITDLPTLDVKSSSSKKTVNKVLGLFKKADSKDSSTSKVDAKANSSIKGEENKSISSENDVPIANSDLVVDKPRRPTSLLLNGIGRRGLAGYNGATSDSVLANDGSNQFSREKTPVSQVKNDETKSQKKGLRLDFSKLPRLNQSIFNKRNSQEMSKSRESSVCKSRESSVCKEDIKPGESSNVEVSNISNNNVETVLSPCLDSNANSTLSNVVTPSWSPDYDTSNFMMESPMEGDINHNGNHHPQRNHEATSPDPENIEDRIRRKSFYSRFNEKKSKRKSLLVGPGAKEYNPTERIHSHTPDSENNVYYNKYDFSPTSSSKSDKSGDFSKYADKNECLSPTKYKNGNESLPSYSYKSLDRKDRKYLLDPPYQPYVEKTSQYSIPRYSRTLSMHDNYETKLPPTEPRSSNSMRYGRSFSLLSPGNYNTYNPRTHSRNSAILMREDTDTEPYTTDSILTKIRNRKKLMAASPTTDDEDYLDTKYRSNIHSASNNNNEHESSDDKVVDS